MGIRDRKILIIGRLPPPIGGVTTHVERLIDKLKSNGFVRFHFAGLDRKWYLARQIFRYRIIHLHISNPYLQAGFAAFCLLTRKKLILTFHGNWGRYTRCGNLAVACAASFAAVPIVQNRESLRKCLRHNARAQLISTYFPAAKHLPVENELEQLLASFRARFRFVACSNAWNLVFDKSGRELYGIAELVSRVISTPEIGLIISDPSKNYASYLKRKFGQLPENVLVLSFAHNFSYVLRFVNVFIRNTTTDGVSLSVHEALAAGVAVLASDSVPRHENCLVFNRLQEIDLEAAVLTGAGVRAGTVQKTEFENPIQKIICIYNKLLES